LAGSAAVPKAAYSLKETQIKLRSAVPAFGLAAVIALSGCSSSNEDGTGIGTQIFTSEYGKVSDAGYAVPAVPISKVDKKFHRQEGPANWAKARLIRYAEDFVVQARYQGSRLQGWIEGQLEGWLGLVINREKTQTIQLKEEGATLDFLGYSFRYEKDRQGQPWR